MSVEAAYLERTAAGQLSEDPAQLEAARKLDGVLHRLQNAPSGGLFRKPPHIRGLYMWGGVGRGKSMLMDLFHELAPVPSKRVHFHEFMGRVHDEMNAWREMDESERRRAAHRVKGTGSDPIPPVAKLIASEAKLICFDEFQVSQIADAMILGRLFENLFEHRVTVVATSNRHPDELYKNGLNRELFLPFIEMIKEQCEVFELKSERDYRLERLTEAPVWHLLQGDAGEKRLDQAFDRLTLGAKPNQCFLTVKGRKLLVPKEAAGVARFSFPELCEKPLGSRDYLAIAANFHTVLLDGIPELTPDKRNEAARFVALIDALYEARVKLVATAAAEPDDLYPTGEGSFEFQRTASRLHEMRSKEYLALEHRVPPRAQELEQTGK
ncbi:cell division protein ZapE [Henriciella aquimarina]|uniref:cell division protein ZapE n=1 Tax=Henriciella aquimarina TaxID=545261 RepID=UPI000A035E6D|nr:cell division protein ZapE [Henriciella aquimarina]